MFLPDNCDGIPNRFRTQTLGTDSECATVSENVYSRRAVDGQQQFIKACRLASPWMGNFYIPNANTPPVIPTVPLQT